MGMLLEAIQKQVHESRDPELAFLANTITETLTECDTIEKGFSYDPKMVIIVKNPNMDDENKPKYLVDYDSLKRCEKDCPDCNNDIAKVYDRVLYDNSLPKEQCGLLVNKINTESIYDYILNSPTPEIKKSRINSLNEFSSDIETLKSNGVKIVKSL